MVNFRWQLILAALLVLAAFWLFLRIVPWQGIVDPSNMEHLGH